MPRFGVFSVAKKLQYLCTDSLRMQTHEFSQIGLYAINVFDHLRRVHAFVRYTKPDITQCNKERKIRAYVNWSNKAAIANTIAAEQRS
jgi:hypothetical protein